MENKNKEITRNLHTVSDLHVREAGEGEKQSRTITGYAILFNTPSAVLYADEEEEDREVIAPEAITRELLDGCDIKMTMFHDRQLILARSNMGEGTLKYSVDDEGVSFEFEAPKTADGDKALELVRRGDIAGCSFAFTTHYYDESFVKPEIEKRDGKTIITYHVNVITGVYDFTLAADPAYPDTTCEAEMREITKAVANKEADEERKKAEAAAAEKEREKSIKKQVAEMRSAAAKKIIY